MDRGGFRKTACAKTLAAMAFSLLATVPGAKAAEISGLAIVEDGDTIYVLGLPVRLYGIDAPESRQQCGGANGGAWDCGQAAIGALEEKIAGRDVRCRSNETDKYKRLLAECHAGADKESLNAWAIRNGWSVAFVKYSSKYVALEMQARKKALGVWRGPFDMPWNYRAQRSAIETGVRLFDTPVLQRSASVSDTRGLSGECVIKGNISKSGERIYHMPGQRWYSKTKINAAAGERWFCSEDEARSAGWRPAKV